MKCQKFENTHWILAINLTNVMRFLVYLLLNENGIKIQHKINYITTKSTRLVICLWWLKFVITLRNYSEAYLNVLNAITRILRIFTNHWIVDGVDWKSASISVERQKRIRCERLKLSKISRFVHRVWRVLWRCCCVRDYWRDDC